ncbi:3168_t:CDS:2 [Ambispora leptoticha]|uniref:3168_t:CDS:1 n=1 Tax=Ambispora leptoticha TaxID=144679 RepID=A0A9N8ZBA6_9GLOM|nr:3168_t:CDS:2 [Ambispora leptoticha]
MSNPNIHARRDFCRTCENLRTIVISKDQKIATLHEELIIAQKSLIVAQDNLLKSSSLRQNKSNNNASAAPLSQPLVNGAWPFIDLPNAAAASNMAAPIGNIGSGGDGDGTDINDSNGNGMNGSHDHGTPIFRAFIGDVPRDIDRTRLIQCLEITFGPVVDIQFIPSKNCAFVHFATQNGYDNAIREGFVYVKGQIDAQKYLSLSRY